MGAENSHSEEKSGEDSKSESRVWSRLSWRWGGNASGWIFGFILEALLIIFSVLLALAVNEWRAERAQEKKARTALAAIHSELEANREAFRDAMRHHRNLRDTLLYFENRDSEPPMALLNQGIFQPAVVYDTAWETAKQSGMTDYMNYDLILDLSALYQRQNRYTGLSDAIVHNFYVKAVMEKNNKELLQDKYRNWTILLRDFLFREQNLIAYLDDTLEKLDQAGKN